MIFSISFRCGLYFLRVWILLLFELCDMIIVSAFSLSFARLSVPTKDDSTVLYLASRFAVLVNRNGSDTCLDHYLPVPYHDIVHDHPILLLHWYIH